MDWTSYQPSLYALLNRYTIAELKILHNDFSLKVKSGLKKADIIELTCNWLINHPDRVIDHLLTYELRLYNEIANHPEKKTKIPYSVFLPPFTDSQITADFQFYTVLAPELEKVLAPLLPDAISQRVETGEEELENYIVGLLNLRGFLPYEVFIEIIKSKNSDLSKLIPLCERFQHLVTKCENGDQAVTSPFAFYVNLNPFDGNQVDPTINEPKKFTDREIYKAAIMPYPEIGGKTYTKLKNALAKCKKDSDKIKDNILDIWLNKQEEDFTIPMLLQSIDIKPEQVETFIPVLFDYLNAIPFWRFKGFSSEEMMQMRPPLMGTRPNITIGPNLRAAGIQSFEQLQEIAERGEPMPPIPCAIKVGRNDPCPCGSGKKYKHCCGR
ncbi:MAG: SEC-C domain-containing protein [Muribaculaceae bacterium]|nr:SEC-C domain-containing protein [Muribaculaceae bacterium]